MPDPVRQLEHTHGHLTKLVADLGAAVGGVEDELATEAWDELAALIGLLRDELMAHFADEEEAVFPFIRASVREQNAAVDRLEAAHDALCELVAAMQRTVADNRRLASMRPLYQRFNGAYADHSVDERALFDGLGRLLGEPQRAELARRLHGLRGAR